MIGQTISHYTILEKLGEGGMGVVYKAQDTKLDRFVALKFLPAHLAASEQDKARFIQEAKSASALNHPNVCTIHDIQEHDGQIFIVMEFVDGQTLLDKKGSLTPKQAIEYGIQIAEGLAAAHEKGIVHRDIKPENIMIRKDGIVQVMDFGLAKLVGASRLTKLGSTVGTLGYMSPEQVQGQETDHRSDIFSLGVLLYEMLTGRSPFNGEHETAILYEVVNVDAAPPSSIKPEIDSSLDAIALECLEKEPSERYQSVAEVSKDLRRFKRESSRTRASRLTQARPALKSSVSQAPEFDEPRSTFSKYRNSFVWIGTSIFFFLVAATVSFFHFRETTPEVQTFRSTILAPEKTTLPTAFGGQIEVSPDGRLVTFIARDSVGKTLLWVRRLDALSAQPLNGTENATYPFWSPDSRFIGFFSSNKLRKIEAAGGPPQIICDASNARGGSWNQDGTIIFAPTITSSLLRVSAAGGIPIYITTIDSARQETGQRWPHFLPDGQHFLYLSRTIFGTVSETDAIILGSLKDSTMKKIVVSAGSNMAYASGHLLYMRDQSLMAQKFDPNRLELSGDAFPIVQQVQFSLSFGKATFSASQNGILLYQTGYSQAGTRLTWYDRKGQQLGFLGKQAIQASPRLSPDGKFLAVDRFELSSRNTDVWVCEIARDVWTRFTFDPANDRVPVWSRDGRNIVFYSDRKRILDLYQRPANGSSGEDTLFESGYDKVPNDWSPDGKFLAMTTSGNSMRNNDLYVLSLTGEKRAMPFLQTEFNEGNATFSLDGKWIAYQSNESGKVQIYVRPFPGPGGKWQVSTASGRSPIWGRNGKEIFFITEDNKLVASPVKWSGASFEVGTPQILFEIRPPPVDRPYDVTADGQRFIVNSFTNEDHSGSLTLVVNWDAEIKKK